MNDTAPPYGNLTPSYLRCEALTDPLAVDHAQPSLSWRVTSEQRGQKQTAYQILAAASLSALAKDQGPLWDSGKVHSDETIHTPYGGHPLAAGQRCWWKVRVWDRDDRVSAWSEAAFFGQGLQPSDWQAEWIGFDRKRNMDLPPAPFEDAYWIWAGGQEAVFVGVLTLPDHAVIQHSLLAITAAGHYRFYFRNEQFAYSDDEPESWRRPHIRHMTERLTPGPNRFIIKVKQRDNEPPGLLFKLTVHLEDGRTFTLVSDATWRATRQIPHEWQSGEGYAAWAHSHIVTAYGAPPWGIIRGGEYFLPPPAYLRRSFRIDQPIQQATLYATAFGAYDLHLNGTRVNTSHFDPGWTDYHRRLYYRAYDVTPLLRDGPNAIGAILADGWYSGYIGWFHARDTYGQHPRFRAQLHVVYANDTSEIIGTDAHWKAAMGPTKEADMLMGERYDARDEQKGWAEPGYNDADWHPVDIGATHTPVLQPHPAPPVVALENERFAPTKITEAEPGIYLFNLGQNFAGMVRLIVRGGAPGQTIHLRHGERLNADGTLYTKNLRTARATDTYICRGDSEETWSPRFTFHGFQYVEVTGLPHPPEHDTITGIPLSTDTPIVGSFTCSDERANRLARNIYWSQRSNFLEIITDCPQRDERLGWCDAAWTFVGAGALRADVQSFYNKWMVDLNDAQYPDGLFPWLAPLVVTKMEISGPMWSGSGPAWADAGVICPWSIYDLYGDHRQLERHYPAMVRQVEWYRRTSRPDLLPPPHHVCLGDWLNYQADIPLDVFRTIFFARSADLLARSAAVLGRSDDAEEYGRLAASVKTAFQRAYVDENGRIDGHTQGGYAFALLYDLLDPKQAEQAARHLVERVAAADGRPTTGLEATLPLMLALAQIGRNDVAYRLLHNDRFPGWNFSIHNGATTIWERWDSWTPEKGFGNPMMNSFNHFSLGAVYQWMAEQIGGIRKEGAAFKHLIIAPEPGGTLTHAHVTYESIRGRIETNWRLTRDQLDVKVQIPANTTATVILPAARWEDITESTHPLADADGITFLKQASGRIHLAAESGAYQFRIRK